MQWSVFMPVVLLATATLAIVIGAVIRDHPSARRAGVIALVAIAGLPAAIVVHNALSAIFGVDEGLSLMAAIVVAPAILAAALLGVSSALVRDAHAARVAVGIGVSAIGLALFECYIVLALVLSVFVERRDVYWHVIEAIALPMCALPVVVGALYAAYGIVAHRRSPGVR